MVFIVDMRKALGKRTHHPADPHDDEPRHDRVFFDNMEVPAENLVGEEGQNFRHFCPA